MGFFKKLFGGGSEEGGEKAGAEPAGEPKEDKHPWPGMLAAAKRKEGDRFSFWEWENTTARQAVAQYLTQIAPSFGNAKIKENPDDENVELRGTFDGSPVRFAVWMSFGTFWSIQMRCQEQLPELEIERDHEKIPKEKDEDDPWDEDEERRVFLGKGIFVEGYDAEIEQNLALWSRLPESLQNSIVTEMERLDMRTVRADGQEVSLNVAPGFDDLVDPLDYMTACAQLMAAIRSGAGTAEGAGAGAPAAAQVQAVPVAAPAHRLTCAYCTSVFILTVGKNTCPNCGAPAQQ
jgi:hypothetical protein